MQGPDTRQRAFTFFNIDFPIVKAACRMAEKRVKIHLESPFPETCGLDSSVLAMPSIRLTFNQDAPLPGHEEAEGLALQEARPQLQRPPMYKVVLLNDDYTPMDFVVEVLEVFFGLDRERATRIMLAVHTEGRAVCGLFTRDVAETKAMQVNQYARESQHPLLCEIEKDG